MTEDVHPPASNAAPGAPGERPARRSAKPRAFKVAALLVATSLALLLAEVGSRVRYAGRTATRVLKSSVLHMPDPQTSYRPAPNRTFEGIHTNSLGLRGREVDEVKHPGTFRVLCIGDSITWGHAATCDDATYPVQLEKDLTRDLHGARPVEVLNGGVGGFGSLQCLRRLREYLPRTHPDEVLICAGWNDLTFAGWRGWYPELNWVNPPDVWTLHESFLVDILREHFTHDAMPLNEHSLELYHENAAEMIREVRATGAKVDFLDLPTVFAPTLTAEAVQKASISSFIPADRERFLAYRDDWVRTAADAGVPVLGTGLDFESEDKTRLLVDVCHPDDAGYVRMAENVAAKVAVEVRASH